GSLDKMPCIFDFLTMGRSKGGVLVLANQDLGSVSSIYGTDKKETFFNNFNVHLVFRLNDPTTSEFLSKAFGEREVIKKLQSSQFSPPHEPYLTKGENPMIDSKPTTEQENKPARNEPVHRIRMSRISAAIWQHESENGTWYNVTLSRSYKDANDEWKSSDSFS